MGLIAICRRVIIFTDPILQINLAAGSRSSHTAQPNRTWTSFSARIHLSNLRSRPAPCNRCPSFRILGTCTYYDQDRASSLE